MLAAFYVPRDVPSGADFVFWRDKMEDFLIYHSFSSPPSGSVAINLTREESYLAKLLLKASLALGIFGVLIILIAYAPSIWYRLAKPYSLTNTSRIIAETVERPIERIELSKSTYQPRFDPKLPYGTRLTIPTIGVNTTVYEVPITNYEDALKKGVWRVSDFGTPYDRTLPTILAAHKYGYLAWSNLFRKQNSFYNLPKLAIGDTVEIVSRQRKYVYEVYAQNEGEEISDYSADLILYTCKDLNSPIRIFKYARLLEI